MTKRRIAFLSILFLFLSGAALATPTTDGATVGDWGGQSGLSSEQPLDEQQLAAYRGTGAAEAGCALATGVGVPLAVAGLVVSSLLLGVPAVVLAIGGAVCMAVL